MTNEVDTIVVGAGVVGLAVARALALTGREVIVIERSGAIGTETSSRNSEVVHAGLYYGRDTLKAGLCVRGRDLLYAYAAAHGIAHERCGKLIVATAPSEEPALAAVEAAARANGVDLTRLDAVAAAALEPEVRCSRALLSPLSGIIDSHALMLQLQADLEAAAGMVVLRTPVLSATAGPGGVEVRCGGADPMALRARLMVNAAGLAAETVARGIAGLPPATIPRVRFAKGNYFACVPRPRFQRLIYPVPEPGGLGIHATRDLAGGVRFGPDVEWTDDLDYCVDPARAETFYAAIRRYWPALPDGALTPDYAGIRPKAVASDGIADFRIAGPETHDVSGLVNLFGIESPGLTASLAIAEHVVALVTAQR